MTMNLTRKEMDQLVNDLFGFEANDDGRWRSGNFDRGRRARVIPSPIGIPKDPAKQRAY